MVKYLGQKIWVSNSVYRLFFYYNWFVSKAVNFSRNFIDYSCSCWLVSNRKYFANANWKRKEGKRVNRIIFQLIDFFSTNFLMTTTSNKKNFCLQLELAEKYIVRIAICTQARALYTYPRANVWLIFRFQWQIITGQPVVFHYWFLNILAPQCGKIADF